MKNILIVDDEKPFLLSLQEGLNDQPEYRVKTALNGQEALDVLKQHKIDLLVTDLKMPVLDGFGLLAHMSGKYPGIPVIVMTAFGSAEIEQRLKQIDNFYYLEKPLDFKLFTDTVSQALAVGERSFIRGINLATFLQLVQLEKKTCTLKIKSKTEIGTLYIDQGNLFSAETGQLSGEAAAFQIVCWQNPEIEMEPICRQKERQITISIEALLLEAFRREDEKIHSQKQDHNSAEQAQLKNQPIADETSVFQLLQESSGIFYNHEAVNKITAENSTSGIRQAEQLSEFLHHSSAVLDFGIYVADDLLFAKKTEQSLMFQLCPSVYFTASTNVATLLGQQQLRHLIIRRGQGPRMLLFVLADLQIVTSLRPGVRCSEFLESIHRLESAQSERQ